MPIPLTLALDCSQDAVCLALISGNALVRSLMAPPADGKRPSDTLLKNIDALFNSAAVQPSEVTDILYGHGPGSFTSLRIGLATLHGLFLPTAIPVSYAGVSSLRLRCLGLAKRAGHKRVIVATRTGRDRIFVGDLGPGGFTEGMIAAQELPEFLKTRLFNGGAVGGTAVQDWDLPAGAMVDIHAGETLAPEDFLAVLSAPDGEDPVSLCQATLNYGLGKTRA